MGSKSALAAAARPAGEPDRLDWAMLDGVLCRRRDDEFAGAALTEGSTSKGDKIVVGFMAAAAPRFSRLFFKLHLNDEMPSDGSGPDAGSWLSQARAVAAHRGCILLCFVIVDDLDPYNLLIDEETGMEYFQEPETREELFVYQLPGPASSSASSSPSALINLPSCGDTYITTSSNLGILRLNDGQFVVARLTVTRCSGGGQQSDCPVTAELRCLFGKDGTWRTTSCVPIRNADGEDHLLWWVTDAVVPFGRYICWVDYLRGILFCDVLSLNPELVYVPLPVNPYDGDVNPEFDGRGALDAYRSVCVTEDGNAMKFVDVSNGTFWFYGRSRHRPDDSAFSSWKMTSGSFVWMEDGRMEEEHFFALAKQHGLPCAPLEFPLVDRNDPQTIYFALKEKKSRFIGEIHLIAVEMLTKKLSSMTPYTLGDFGDLEGGTYSSTTSCNLFYHEPFLSFEFSKHLNLDVSNSRDREDVEGLVEALQSSMLLPENMDLDSML